VSYLDALDIVVARTNVERLRYLCSDANTRPPPNSAADYRRYVVETAEAPPAPPTPTEVMGQLASMRGCPFWSRCTCSGGRCGLRGAAIVSHRDCFACLETYG
jgi:hypothetical protein